MHFTHFTTKPGLSTSRAFKERHRSAAPSSWQAEARLDVFMLRIEDACAPGDKGLLNPILQRYRAGTGTLEIFGLPAVQVILNRPYACIGGRVTPRHLRYVPPWS